VSIDQPLYSNGGDITIVANELYIGAPIDSRPRFKVGPEFWEPQVAGHGDALDTALAGAPNLMKPFQALYFWREVYDPAQYRYVFKVQTPPQPDVRPYVDANAGDNFVQLPSGRVPIAPCPDGPEDVRPVNGGDAPDKDVNWDSIKSGTIRIFAAKIDICQACLAALQTVPVAPRGSNAGDTWDRVGGYVAFLNAAGLKGGRGAAGSLNCCPGLAVNPLCSAMRGQRGGLSGSPGRGGDAGDVEVHFVNHAFSVAETVSLKNIIKIDGGYPTNKYKMYTEPLSLLYKYPTRNTFNDAIGIPLPEQIIDFIKLGGLSGNYTIDSIETDAALSQIGLLLTRFDLTRSYALADLVAPARLNSDSLLLNPSDVIGPFLLREISRLHQSALDETEASLSSNAPLAGYSPFFSSLNCNANGYSALSDVARELVNEMCLYRPVVGFEGIRGLFARFGGVLKPPSGDPTQLVQHADIVEDLGSVQELLTKLFDEAVDTNQGAKTERGQRQTEQIKQKITALEAARQALIDAAARANNHTLADVVKDYIQVSQSFTKAANEISAGQLWDGGTDLYKGGSLLDSLLTYKVIPDGPDTSE
jgi:hypothetical protein